jgi:hypothetical protein
MYTIILRSGVKSIAKILPIIAVFVFDLKNSGKSYGNTFFHTLKDFVSNMVSSNELECLFQNFFQVFNFGHLFLSIFENQIDFWESNRDQFFSP